MITPDGWFDWAERQPGPPEKVWPDVNANQGVVYHSAVGSLQGVINVVTGPVENNRSVTGVVAYDGRLVQFYPITASPWANGGHVPNRLLLGFEHEGGANPYNEPLTEAQIATDVRILQDLAKDWRRPTSPTDKDASLYEHNEMTRWGAAPTACPSGRIPWDEILQRLAPPPAVIDGLGVHYVDGGAESVWAPQPGRELDGIGVHLTDGTERRLWPPE